MGNRFVSIWFRHLKTDWFSIRQPHLKNLPFVLRTPSHGRMIITAANAVAVMRGISCGVVLADARAIFPELEVQDDKPDLVNKLLTRLAEWCIRFTPIAAIDPPDGIVLDVSGCSHLWGGDTFYLEEIARKLNARGYDIKLAMADTIGAAWGVARFGKESLVASGMHSEALMSLPPESLRIEFETVMRLHKLGLRQVRQFISMPRSSLRRRFGEHLLHQIDKAFGHEMELMQPVQPIEPYQERLPCLEPIVTLTGIEMALKQLLETLCHRLQQEQKGLRSAMFKGYRVDGKVEQISIGTNRPTHHVKHLYKLLEGKLSLIEPAMGIELFVLEAQKVEDHFSEQTKVWEGSGGLEDIRVSELLDRLATKTGMQSIHRYAPDEHYWPERSYKQIALEEKLAIPWRTDKPRPLQLLSKPECIEVTAPIPDYPPMLFRYKGKLHTIAKADGPERIEQEWWLQQGQHRDYYRVEDVEGNRYWLFRLGHYHDETYQWFIHGFFA
ncbi:MAG: DNA polymerase Y family protein [Bacteroidetes bacterium]|nr:DNA polymerase Y family protein [Bacteroidota bacterium]